MFSLLKRFGDDDSDGLTVEINLVRVEIRNARRCRTRLFALLSKDCGLLHRGRVLVREDTDDARCVCGRARINMFDFPPGNAAEDECAVRDVVNIVLGGERRLACCFQPPVNAAERLANGPRLRPLGSSCTSCIRQRCQHTHHRAPGEFDLECIVLVATCHFEFFRCRFEGVFTCWRADENFFAAKARQGLCHAAQSQACLLIVPSSTSSAASDRDERERIAGAVAHLRYLELRAQGAGQFDRRNQLIRLQVRVRLRGVFRQAMKVDEGNRTLAVGASDLNRRIKRGEAQHI